MIYIYSKGGLETSRITDLTGQRFGKLTVIDRAADRYLSSGRKRVAWNCVCDCGNHIVVCGDELKKGDTTSCGCKRKGETNGNYRHGLRDTRLYGIWANMKQRCTNQNSSEYYRYGGRGISVCEEWSSSFIKFKEWAMDQGYDDTLTIERIDVDGNYEPSNCSFVTMKRQMNNTSRNHWMEYNGEIHTMSEWSDILNIPYNTLRSRVNVLKWDDKKALSTPFKR